MEVSDFRVSIAMGIFPDVYKEGTIYVLGVRFEDGPNKTIPLTLQMWDLNNGLDFSEKIELVHVGGTAGTDTQYIRASAAISKRAQKHRKPDKSRYLPGGLTRPQSIAGPPYSPVPVQRQPEPKPQTPIHPWLTKNPYDDMPIGLEPQTEPQPSTSTTPNVPSTSSMVQPSNRRSHPHKCHERSQWSDANNVTGKWQNRVLKTTNGFTIVESNHATFATSRLLPKGSVMNIIKIMYKSHRTYMCHRRTTQIMFRYQIDPLIARKHHQSLEPPWSIQITYIGTTVKRRKCWPNVQSNPLLRQMTNKAPRKRLNVSHHSLENETIMTLNAHSSNIRFNSISHT